MSDYDAADHRDADRAKNGAGSSKSVTDSAPRPTNPRPTANGAVPPFKRTRTRADLLDAVYDSCPSLSRHQARDIFEMTLDEMAHALTRGEPVKLRSFGLFSVREKRERIGRNPRTGEEVPIKPRRVLTFRPSPVLLDQVNGEDSGAVDAED